MQFPFLFIPKPLPKEFLILPQLTAVPSLRNITCHLSSSLCSPALPSVTPELLLRLHWLYQTCVMSQASHLVIKLFSRNQGPCLVSSLSPAPNTVPAMQSLLNKYFKLNGMALSWITIGLLRECMQIKRFQCKVPNESWSLLKKESNYSSLGALDEAEHFIESVLYFMGFYVHFNLPRVTLIVEVADSK